MKLGVAALATDRGLGITSLAKQIEDAGLESLFVAQNTHVPASGVALLEEDYHHSDHHFLDPFAAISAAAAVTSRIKLGTGICVAPIYDPIILAMQVATVDLLSSGRFQFGIGVGHEDTVRNHGVNPELRHRVMREKVQAMKVIWADSEPEFHGEFVDFAPMLAGIRPSQQPHPPILIGTQGNRGIARVADYADGWMPIVYEEMDLSGQMEELKRRCQAAGRPTASVTAGVWGIDEPLLERCASLGIDRCLAVIHAEDPGYPAFLDRYSRLVDRFGD